MPLVANKRIRYNGEVLEAGDILEPEPAPIRTKQLVDHNYAHWTEQAQPATEAGKD